MKASEILRKMADIIDSKESGQQSNTEITNRPEIVDVEVSAPADAGGIEGDAQVNTRSMVAPLQQKLELLKKAAGVDNMYDGEEECCDACGQTPCGCESDELDVMKRNAGIPVAIQVSAEDNEIEG